MKKAARTLVSIVCAFALLLPSLAGITARAAAQTFLLRVEGASNTVLNEEVPCTAGQSLEDALKTALDAQDVPYTFTPSSYGDYVETIGSDSGAADYSTWWGIYQNGVSSSLGISSLKPAAGDEIVLAFISSSTLYPKVSFSPAVPTAGQNFTMTVSADQITYDASGNSTTQTVPVSGAAVTFNGTSETTDADGSVTFTAPSTAGKYMYSLTKNGTGAAPDLVRTGDEPIWVYTSAPNGIPSLADVSPDALASRTGRSIAVSLDRSGDAASFQKDYTPDVRTGAQHASASIPSGTVAAGLPGTGATLDGFQVLENAPSSANAYGTPGMAVKAGSGTSDVTLSLYATVTLFGQTGKSAEYIDAENAVHPITRLSSNAAPTDGSTGYYDNGTDLLIYTKHLSTFVSYTPAAQVTAAEIAAAKQGAETALAGDVSDWSSFALTRAGKEAPAGYLPQVAAELNEQNGNPSVVADLAKYILTLRAAKADPTNFNGVNLVDELYRRTDIDAGYPPEATFVLLALDSADYAAPAGAAVTKQALVQNLLNIQDASGGFALSAGFAPDVDVTAMVLSALAPHLHEAGVQNAVDQALTFLSNKQQADGGFVPAGSSEESAESAAQVLIALSSLKIDAASNARFVQNGHSVVEALLSYRKADGSFSHTSGGDTDSIATQQALEALVAYVRFAGNTEGLYDLRDVTPTITNVAPAKGTENTTSPDGTDSTGRTASTNSSRTVTAQIANPQTGYSAPDTSVAVFLLFCAAGAIGSAVVRRRQK